MTDRRRMLGQLAAGAAAIPSVTLGATTLTQGLRDDSDCECVRPHSGPHSDYFPNLVVYTHENRRALFYNDLLHGKTVLINCMSIRSDAIYPVMEKLLKVQALLGSRLGRDVFMYSLTLEPERDTPRALSDFARRHGVKPGWLFLTGRAEVMDAVRGRLFFHGLHRHGSGQIPDCSRGLIRYGNESVGLWGAVPVRTEPEWIVKRLSWVEAGQSRAGTFVRKGPRASFVNRPSTKKTSGRA